MIDAINKICAFKKIFLKKTINKYCYQEAVLVYTYGNLFF